MIKSFQSQYNHFRLIIFQLKRVNFLNDPNKKKKTESDSKPVNQEKKIVLSEEQENIIKQLKERNKDITLDYSDVKNEDFKFFSDMKQRKESLKDLLLEPIYDLDIHHENIKMTEQLKNLSNKVKDLNVHPQLNANIERMNINELNFFQMTLFKIINEKKNVLVKTNYPIAFDKYFSFIFPSVNMILNKKIIPTKNENFNTCAPFTIFIDKDKDSISQIFQLSRMICHNTGIKIQKIPPYDRFKKDYLKKISSSEILVTSLERIQEFLRNNLLRLDYLENVVILNYNDLQLREKKFLTEFCEDVKNFSKYTVFFNRDTEEFVKFKSSVITDYYSLLYYNKDYLNENYKDKKVVENNERISHLALAYDINKLQDMYNKILNMMNVEGIKISKRQLKIVQVHDSSHLFSLIRFCELKNISFIYVNEKNSSNVIMRGNVIITNELFLVTSKNIKKASLVINIGIPIRLKNFFTLVGNHGENLASTITFIEGNEDNNRIAEFTGFLKEYNQQIPEFLNKD